jgi:hypothetical protein
MDRESTRGLKLDKRLTRRRGWIEKDELTKALEALPDVSGKAMPTEGDDAPAAADPANPS